jgi:3-oxoacyl-[acyl-carrier protein] reductase
MNLGLAGRVALITGAAGGIGSAIATALASEGCDVALLDLQCDNGLRVVLEQIEAGGTRALMLGGDVRDAQRAAAVVGEVASGLGGLDILVCAAGITRDGVSWKLSERDWDDVLDINLKGSFNYARAVIPAMRERGAGRIVNIGSINGMRGKFGQTNYAASKAGLIGLSKALAREVGRFGITVNVIAPGMTETAMTERLSADMRAAALAETALGRLCDPADIANAAVFLCSEMGRQITGEVLRVDGGQYI